MSTSPIPDDIATDVPSLKYFAHEVKKRLDQEKESAEENDFLRSSLRRSNRLQAIEDYRRIVKQAEIEKRPELNEAFEGDEGWAYSRSELSELISYLRTKVQTRNCTSAVGTQSTGPDPSSSPVAEDDQWEWLLSVLCDPLIQGAFLMHDRVASAYEQCKSRLGPKPRHRWPILPGMACDVLDTVLTQVFTVLQRPICLDTQTVNNLSYLNSLLSRPNFKNLLLAMDGLANTWLFDAGEDAEDVDTEDGLGSKLDDQGSTVDGEAIKSDVELDPNIEYSVVPGCYATLAYDEQGRDSYSEQGVRLKYVVLQKGDNEFLGATVRCERRSIIIARIVNGGLAQKTDLLHEGDELLAANGIELLGKDLNTVTEILGSLHGQVVLLVAPSADPYSKAPRGGIIHLRALFTYEPNEDRYLACHELGLPFIKGDLVHVTGRNDPNWWQAYRSDEDAGLTGAVGTLAGLIPSPLYQRQRAILRLQYWLDHGTEDVELEDEPSDVDISGTDTDTSLVKASRTQEKNSAKRFLGMKFSFLDKRNKSGSTRNPVCDSSTPVTPITPNSEDSPSATEEDDDRALINSALLSSIYAGRLSGHARLSSQLTEGVVNEWSAAGPVWGQHGYEARSTRGHRHLGRKSGNKSSKTCLPGIRVPDAALQNDDDPVAWLDEEVKHGFLRHSSLWTYEPVAQYLPQPLRRRPLIFVGPAHVGRHQLMQRLIQDDPDRFCPAAIHTTNAQMKKIDTSSTPYICVTTEEFETLRRRGQFIEWGVFNRARYGTSQTTVRKIVEDGKVCCITLRPDSLRLMRATGLMPYVIFISPPERVDELRRVQKQLGLKVNCTDMELKSCIEISRKMEVRFGHWFDKVLVPDTLDATVEELRQTATKLEREPSWVPRHWLY